MRNLSVQLFLVCEGKKFEFLGLKSLKLYCTNSVIFQKVQVFDELCFYEMYINCVLDWWYFSFSKICWTPLTFPCVIRDTQPSRLPTAGGSPAYKNQKSVLADSVSAKKN